MAITPEFQDKFDSFYDGMIKIERDYMKKHFPNNPLDEFSYKIGRRYIKIIRGTSVHAFIDIMSGDVLKPASWNAPAKYARGNIFNKNNGLNYMTPYGPVYLK
ncbi:MAG: hypothetical protein KQ78_00017 [Candidatus Izimaplasma bacterium HR2]|nr:MAG: hypothetical protein KQ78_00017 [Candidatus Izimaplasma bacterium HR2]